MESAYIVEIIRTPIGRYVSIIASERTNDPAAIVIGPLLRCNPVIAMLDHATSALELAWEQP